LKCILTNERGVNCGKDSVTISEISQVSTISQNQVKKVNCILSHLQAIPKIIQLFRAHNIGTTNIPYSPKKYLFCATVPLSQKVKVTCSFSVLKFENVEDLMPTQ
jgi:hypothetical protein